MERSTEAPFNEKARRDAHELLQMPEEERQRIEAIRAAGEKESAVIRKQQAQRWSRDIDAATHDIYRDHDAQRAQRPWWHLRSARPSPREVANLAVQRVQERNRAALLAVEQIVRINEEAVRHAWRVRERQPEQERAAIEAMRDRLKRDREATRGIER